MLLTCSATPVHALAHLQLQTPSPNPTPHPQPPSPCSWSDLMIQLGLGPNSYLTIFVMEYARYGSLEKAALKKGEQESA